MERILRALCAILATLCAIFPGSIVFLVGINSGVHPFIAGIVGAAITLIPALFILEKKGNF